MIIQLSSSDVVTAISIVVTIGATCWAIYERISATSARKEVARFRQLLILQQIAQQFSGAPTRALALFRAVRGSEWDNGAEVALILSSDLASLSGAEKHLGDRLDQETLQTALQVLSEMNRLMPRLNQLPAEETMSHLIDACNVVLLSVSSLERALSTSAALGGDYDGDIIRTKPDIKTGRESHAD